MPPVVTGWWSYLLITEGAPLIHTASGCRKAPAGTLLILHPECPCGIEDTGESRCRQLCWIWKDAPLMEDLIPEKGRALLLEAEPDLVRVLSRIHRECRLEIARSDGCTRLALQRLRIEADVGIARALGSRESDSSVRLHLALSFLEQNTESPALVRDLCEYLQVSEHALKRLFHANFQLSPRQYIQRLRMQQAEKLLEDGRISVKEIAYRMGYRHPNDFSRAYRKFFGISASERKRRG